MSNFHIVVGEQPRVYRKRKGLMQEQLAESADPHYSYIGGVERGERNISLETLEKIINALDIEPIELFQFNIIDNANEDKKLNIKALNSILLHRRVDEIKLILKLPMRF